MTSATLSLATSEFGKPPRLVRFDCPERQLYDSRPLGLGLEPPFTAWSRDYARATTPEALLAIGVAIGRWLEDGQRWLSQLLAAPRPVILTIETSASPTAVELAALAAPWELLAHADPAADAAMAPELRPARHLAQDSTFMIVRRVGPPAQERSQPSPYRLSTLFMAAQPAGLAALPADQEEAAIDRSPGQIGMELAVEESGVLSELADLAARDYDVIHLCCHVDRAAEPVLVFEGRAGERADVTAGDLAGSITTRPRLLVVSASPAALPASASGSNREPAGHDLLGPLAAELCRRGWPAVITCPRTDPDPTATALVEVLYRQLARCTPLPEAIANARSAIAKTAAWHAPRLLLGPTSADRIVSSTAPHPDRTAVVLDPGFLDENRTIPLAPADPRFAFRPARRRLVRALREGNRGALVHGGDALARATFVARVLRRLAPYASRRVVVARDFDARMVIERIRGDTALTAVALIADRHRQMLQADPCRLDSVVREILEGPCQAGATGAFVLVLYDVEPAPQSATVVRALVRAFRSAATHSRLLITAKAAFPIIDSTGEDLGRSLVIESLDGDDPPGSAAIDRALVTTELAAPDRLAYPPSPGQARSMELPMTRDELLAQLKAISPGQFEEVVERCRIPPAYLSGENAPQVKRAIEILRFLEPHGRLAELARILAQVGAPPPPGRR